MHTTACGVGASAATSATASIQSSDALKMPYNSEDATNKIPLKSASGIENDDEKNGGEMILDIAGAAEEARREQMRANILKWMKKLTIVLICFIGIALISYVIISLCFSDWSKSHPNTSSSASSNSSLLSDDSNNFTHSNNSTSSSNNQIQNNATNLAAFGVSNMDAKTLAEAAATTTTTSTIITSTTTTAPVLPVVADTTTETETQTKPSVAVDNDASTLHDTPITVQNFASKLGVFKEAAVCSDKEVCSQIGSNILDQGGSAVDSAIATVLCNGIVSMQSLGIGGGMLMNIFIKESKHAYSIDARGVAPFAAYPEMFSDKLNATMHGALAITVPGELMGHYRAHERFGKLPWKKLVEPSIKLCNEGYFLSHHQWMAFNDNMERLLRHGLPNNNTLLTNVFINATTGKVHPIGTKIKPHKELCKTYALLAKEGPMDFYNGTLAKLVAEDLRDIGSIINAYDLEAYAADLVNSITMQLGNDTLYVVPPISSGSVVAHILSILEGYNFTKADLEGDINQAKTIHRITEAMKFGFAKRWELGDLRFNDVRELVSKLNSPEYSKEIYAQINDSHVLSTLSDYGAQFSGVDDTGTSQTSVLAPNGDAVSVTSSINFYFGAGLVGKRTGIIFNSEMDDFAIAGQSNFFGLPAAPSNFIEAQKRPMSSMSPMILADRNGNVRLVIGAAGGTKIISGIVEVAMRVLWFGQNIKEAIDAPRMHDQLVPNVLQYQENGYSQEILKLLEAKGHKVKPYSDIGSVVCGIVRNETAIYANADYRKRGGIAGF